ncbi:hypothetical protein EDD37DRAFT_82294 [Exophiala viscosa]|uniref:uncharacterized protein n=1 Tax=Exophiala viscosa TaxID=2486360 RepID=UPI002198B9C8|nr:hypothetical protein EDD37DRAFT_82294 [Exophiala viscosa]
MLEVCFCKGYTMLLDSSITIVLLNTLLLIQAIYFPLPALLRDHLAALKDMFRYHNIYILMFPCPLSMSMKRSLHPHGSRLSSLFEINHHQQAVAGMCRPCCILLTYNTCKRIDHEFKVWLTPQSATKETTPSVTISEQTRSRPRTCIPTNSNIRFAANEMSSVVIDEEDDGVPSPKATTTKKISTPRNRDKRTPTATSTARKQIFDTETGSFEKPSA